MRFYPLEKLINLHDAYTRQFKIDNLQLLLMQRRGELFLIEAHCPHRNQLAHAPQLPPAPPPPPCLPPPGPAPPPRPRAGQCMRAQGKQGEGWGRGAGRLPHTGGW